MARETVRLKTSNKGRILESVIEFPMDFRHAQLVNIGTVSTVCCVAASFQTRL